jgi:glutamate-1-semialdehyde 2,1-aminomutase
VPFQATGYGSMIGLHFSHEPIRRVDDIPDAPELRALMHLHLLEQGYSYARRGFVALSVPLEERDVDGFAAAAEAFLNL